MELTIPHYETMGRIMFYGFKTTEDWLIDYAITHRATYGIRVTEFGILNLQNALYILQRQTGINQLRLKSVLPENTPIPPPLEGNRRIGPLPEPGLPIVAVCSSRSTSFHKRPSQAQVDHLKQILGGEEPKWWIKDSD